MIIKSNILAQIHEKKDKFILFFEAHGKQDLLLSIKSKEFVLRWQTLWMFSTYFCRARISPCINGYDATNILVAKLERGIVECSFFFLTKY